MRRPHVFERSAPRPGKDGYQEPAGKAVAARTIAAQLGSMLDRATAADLPMLVELLEAARAEAEKLAASESQPPGTLSRVEFTPENGGGAGVRRRKG